VNVALGGPEAGHARHAGRSRVRWPGRQGAEHAEAGPPSKTCGRMPLMMTGSVRFGTRCGLSPTRPYG